MAMQTAVLLWVRVHKQMEWQLPTSLCSCSQEGIAVAQPLHASCLGCYKERPEEAPPGNGGGALGLPRPFPVSSFPRRTGSFLHEE